MASKNMLVRMSEELHGRLDNAAQLAGISMNSLVVDAVTTYLDALSPTADTTPDVLLQSARLSYVNNIASTSATATASNPYEEAISRLSGET